EYTMLTGKHVPTAENYTYLLFTSPEARERLQPILEQTYTGRLQLPLTSWTYLDRQGLIIPLPYEEANTKPLEANPITMDMLQEQGFQIVARLSNRIQPFTQAEVEGWLKRLSQRGVKRIVFDGEAITGFDEDPE